MYHFLFLLSILLIFRFHSSALSLSSSSSSKKATAEIRVLYAGLPGKWEKYKNELDKAFQNEKLNVNLFNYNGADSTSSSSKGEPFDYIIYTPRGQLQDFTPYTANDNKVKAILNLQAGVEKVVNNPTLPHSIPLCRTVDPGLRYGMIEYIVGHILRYHIQADFFWQKKKQGEWWQDSNSDGSTMLALAKDTTIGILGLGELGGACATALINLNFRVAGWSRTEKKEKGVDCYHGRNGLYEMLSKSDIIVLLLPNTKETYDIINKETLSKCKHGVKIINVGRGSLVNDEDLIEAIELGIVSHATLDVFKQEPLPLDHKYWKLSNVLITPHVAAKTRIDTSSVVIAENIRRFENGEDPLYVVDRDAGY